MQKRQILLPMILLGLFAFACGIFWPGGAALRAPVSSWGYASNGERIYFTATNDDGEYISYTGGSSYGGMMGGRLACVSCHGADGRGGLHWMHMQQMDAPDIRYSALAQGEHEGGIMEYDLEAFRQAVVLGRHPDGEPLGADMPRWSLDEDDLADLFEFLKTLP
ncbi:MAG: cytochrome C oxidase subunit II [Anaerolineae bacterium CG03_land_8_20_14_0_80_58_20]|nr:MAG: cytochrome C oxidase subunit II [Anaerolineae bacterium CG03_land_8_20_14_0_80_58_20]